MALRVLSIIGTRPEAVKMAPVVSLLNRTAGIESRLCVTAQHRQMLDQVLKLYELQPDYDLDLMREDQSLPELSAAILKDLQPVLTDYHPDWILVQGDTTTVAIASLLAYYNHIRVGHVEAGLRTHDKWQPFPEEINRRIAGVTADLHFAPTAWARENLLKEGIDGGAITITGNPVIDALQHVASQPEPEEVSRLVQKLNLGSSSYQWQAGQSSKGHIKASTSGQRLVLVTAHRRESFGAPLENICLALEQLASRGDIEIVYPVHLNPNVQETVNRILNDVPHVSLMPPMDYLPLVHLMKHASLILTDSGGLQEEAPTFGIPVLVLRAVTERPEGLEAGVLKLVGTDVTKIRDTAAMLLDNAQAYAEMARASNPFGDGHAAQRIVSALLTAH